MGLVTRSRTPIQEGASKRLQRMKLLFHLVQIAMPEGIERNELVSEYSIQTGLTLRKAEEHLELLEEAGILRWEDLRLYITQKGLRWAGFVRDSDGKLLDKSESAEEEYREHKRTSTQRAPISEQGPDLPIPGPIE